MPSLYKLKINFTQYYTIYKIILFLSFSAQLFTTSMKTTAVKKKKKIRKFKNYNLK